MVGRGGLEPPTSRLSGVRSNHLSYRPIFMSRRALGKRRGPKRRAGLRFIRWKGHEDGPTVEGAVR